MIIKGYKWYIQSHKNVLSINCGTSFIMYKYVKTHLYVHSNKWILYM